MGMRKHLPPSGFAAYPSFSAPFEPGHIENGWACLAGSWMMVYSSGRVTRRWPGPSRSVEDLPRPAGRGITHQVLSRDGTRYE